MSDRQQFASRSQRVNTVQNLDLSKARRAIEYFIFSCSNTLSEPLKQINHLCSMIMNSRDSHSDETIVRVEEIRQSIASMESIVADLQHFLTYAHTAIAIKSIDTNLLVKDIISDYTTIIDRENIHLNVTIDQSLPFYTDRGSFRMILSQLISNAIRFADETKQRKEVFVMVSVSKEACRVSVRDNGIGIDASFKAEIFNLFFKRPMQSSGSGVGLFIVKELTSALGSEIKLKSESGEGSEFYFETENLWVADQ